MKIIILLAIIPLFTSGVMMNYSNEAFAEKSITFEPKSLFKIGDNSYLLIFIGCTGSEPIGFGTFVQDVIFYYQFVDQDKPEIRERVTFVCAGVHLAIP